MIETKRSLSRFHCISEGEPSCCERRTRLSRSAAGQPIVLSCDSLFDLAQLRLIISYFLFQCGLCMFETSTHASACGCCSKFISGANAPLYPALQDCDVVGLAGRAMVDMFSSQFCRECERGRGSRHMRWHSYLFARAERCPEVEARWSTGKFSLAWPGLHWRFDQPGTSIMMAPRAMGLILLDAILVRIGTSQIECTSIRSRYNVQRKLGIFRFNGASMVAWTALSVQAFKRSSIQAFKRSEHSAFAWLAVH